MHSPTSRGAPHSCCVGRQPESARLVVLQIRSSCSPHVECAPLTSAQGLGVWKLQRRSEAKREEAERRKEARRGSREAKVEARDAEVFPGFPIMRTSLAFSIR